MIIYPTNIIIIFAGERPETFFYEHRPTPSDSSHHPDMHWVEQCLFQVGRPYAPGNPHSRPAVRQSWNSDIYLCGLRPCPAQLRNSSHLHNVLRLIRHTVGFSKARYPRGRAAFHPGSTDDGRTDRSFLSLCDRMGLAAESCAGSPRAPCGFQIRCFPCSGAVCLYAFDSPSREACFLGFRRNWTCWTAIRMCSGLSTTLSMKRLRIHHSAGQPCPGRRRHCRNSEQDIQRYRRQGKGKDSEGGQPPHRQAHRRKPGQERYHHDKTGR